MYISTFYYFNSLFYALTCDISNSRYPNLSIFPAAQTLSAAQLLGLPPCSAASPTLASRQQNYTFFLICQNYFVFLPQKWKLC